MDIKFGEDSPLEDKFDSELNPKPKPWRNRIRKIVLYPYSTMF